MGVIKEEKNLSEIILKYQNSFKSVINDLQKNEDVIEVNLSDISWSLQKINFEDINFLCIVLPVISS